MQRSVEEFKFRKDPRGQRATVFVLYFSIRPWYMKLNVLQWLVVRCADGSPESKLTAVINLKGSVDIMISPLMLEALQRSDVLSSFNLDERILR